MWGRQQYRMLAACSAEFSHQRGHERADPDGLQSTHSHSKGYISFLYSWRTQRHQGHLESQWQFWNFFFSKNVLVFFYCQHFIMKIFKDTVKLKEFYSEPRYLESIINILLCLLYHFSIYSLIHLIWYFKVNGRYHIFPA